MKILSITTWDNLGYQFNGYQIHQTLLKSGHISNMVVKNRGFDEVNIHQIGNPITRKIDNGLRKIEKKLNFFFVLFLQTTPNDKK